MNSPAPRSISSGQHSHDGTLILLAFACDARQGSEPGAGWTALVSACNLFSKIVLVTRASGAPQLSSDVRSLPAVVEVVAIPTHFDRLENVYPRYAAWIVAAARFVKARLQADSSITVVHHVTYASDWMPSPVALLPKDVVRGRRIVWGPVGGATYPPRRALGLFPWSFRAKELIRLILTSTVRAVALPLHRRVVDVAVALNSDTAAKLKRFPVTDVAANIALDAAALPPQRSSQREHVAVFAGRPLELKGIRLLLEAHRISGNEWTLELYGATPAAFAEFGDVSAPGVVVMGKVDRSVLLKRLGQVAVLALPSLHDSAPWIAAEAAAMGARVVSLDLGGVSMMADGRAMVVPTLPATSLPQRLAKAIDVAVLESPAAAVTTRVWDSTRYEENLSSWYGGS